MNKALYRKYRSKSLDEIVGQNHITDILSRAVQNGRVSHAYLFTGPRGVGKTSIARILAHSINNLPYDEQTSHLDIIEIDAASNNGVEDVRDLREKVRLAPVSASKKIYIIDEVHMLSKPAFNALLKTLEEPPEHVVFILATTDADKLPDTIVSRTQRFNFRPISKQDAAKHLGHIAKQEKIKAKQEALELIAEMGDGSFRDSISLLDQMSSLSDEAEGITVELVEQTLGLAKNSAVEQLINLVDKGDVSGTVQALEKLYEQGSDSIILASQIVSHLRQSSTNLTGQHFGLIDKLIELPRSSKPDIKLISVLGLAASYNTGPAPVPKSAALSTTVMEVSASVEELKKDKPNKPKSVKKTLTRNTGTMFDWKKLLEHAKSNHIALYTVINKCGHLVDGDQLTIYTGNKLFKTKLDESKYKSLLQKSLTNLGFGDFDIHTLATTLPPKSSQAAAVADIMGGGEEVIIDL